MSNGESRVPQDIDLTEEEIAEFWSLIGTTNDEGHDLWLGPSSTKEDGSHAQPVFHYGPRHGRMAVMARRVYYRLVTGHQPGIKTLIRSCPEPLCMNPYHWFVSGVEGSIDTFEDGTPIAPHRIQNGRIVVLKRTPKTAIKRKKRTLSTRQFVAGVEATPLTPVSERSPLPEFGSISEDLPDFDEESPPYGDIWCEDCQDYHAPPDHEDTPPPAPKPIPLWETDPVCINYRREALMLASSEVDFTGRAAAVTNYFDACQQAGLSKVASQVAARRLHDDMQQALAVAVANQLIIMGVIDG